MLRRLIHTLKNRSSESGAVTTPEWTAFQAASTDRALQRIVSRGLKINTVVDVGASNGSWSEVCMKHFPDSAYLLLEAQSCHTEALEVFCRHHPNAKFLLAAAGNADGSCFFDDGDPFGGLASNEANANCRTPLPMVKLDTVLGESALEGPYMLKLDTHGFELQIIQGAEQMLQQTELAVIEAYIFRLNDKALLSHELCAEMDRRGFQLIDFSEPLWRGKDMALWQWDLFFVKKDNPVFQSNTFA